MAADIAAMSAEFHTALGQHYGDGGDPALRMILQTEEHCELIDALVTGDQAAIAQELADVVYVAYGTAHSLGLDLDAVITEVHRANMSKFDVDGTPILREDGKLLKGPNFRAADVAGVLAAANEVVPAVDAARYCCPDCGSEEPLPDAVAELVHEWGMAIPADRFEGTTTENATVRVTTDEAMDLARRARALGQGGAR